MKNRCFVRILSAIILLSTIVAGILIIASYMKTEKIRRSMETIMINRPTLISYLTEDSMLMGFNGFDFGSNVKGILDDIEVIKTYKKGYLPIPLRNVPLIWEDIVEDACILDVDGKLVGVRMRLSYDLKEEGVPYEKLMTAIIGKEPDANKIGETTWLFPNFTITLGIIPLDPNVLYFYLPEPDQGITIIDNKAIGQEVNYTNTYIKPFVWITK